MKVVIEVYRGFEISFDTGTEMFVCYQDATDSEGTKKSFTAAKKWIDDFIKENTTFKRVLIIYRVGSYKHAEGKSTLTGIRKDERFVAENAKGAYQISGYDEKDIVIYDPAHDEISVKYNEYSDKIRSLQEEQRQYLKDNYNPVTLQEYRKTIY